MSEMNRREFGRSGLAGLAILGGAAKLLAAPGGAVVEQGGAAAYRYIHLDVFTDRRLQGNQLFVFV